MRVFKMMLLRALCVITVLSHATVAVAFDGNCYYELTDVATVYTYGEIINPDGTKTKIPLGSTTYYYYTYTCDQYPDPYYSGGSSSYLPLKPKVTIFAVDTTDPIHPSILVDVASDANSPAVSLTLTVGSQTITTQAIGWDGNYKLSFPAVMRYADGTTSFSVRACTAANSCGSGSGSFSRYTPSPLKTSGQFSARWIEGDEFKYAAYSHLYQQSYTTTQFNYVEELSQNSARHLRKGYVTLSWPSAGTSVIYNAGVQSWGLLSQITPLGSCTSPTVCAQPCLTKCKEIATVGLMMEAEDRISLLQRSDAAEIMDIYAGDAKLHLNIP